MTSTAAPSARDRILTTADRLFYATGVRAVGVDRVIAEAGVAKMTFFRHFPTKDDLVVAFLEQREQASRAELTRIRAEQPDGPRAVLGTIAAEVSTIPVSDGFRGLRVHQHRRRVLRLLASNPHGRTPAPSLDPRPDGGVPHRT